MHDYKARDRAAYTREARDRAAYNREARDRATYNHTARDRAAYSHEARDRARLDYYRVRDRTTVPKTGVAAAARQQSGPRGSRSRSGKTIS